MQKIVFLFLVAILLTSCSVTEKMMVNENNQADYKIGFDMSALLKMDKKSKEERNKPYQKIDSSFSVAQIIAKIPKDSLAKMTAEQKIGLDLAKDFSINMNIDEENKVFRYEMGLKINDITKQQIFPSSKELGDLLAKNDKSFKSFSSLGSDKKEDKEPKEKVVYFYDGKIFTKTTQNYIPKKLDPKKKPIPTKKKSKKDEFAQFGEELEKLLKDCKYKTEYHFPKPIKSVNIKGAVISADKKSFVYEIPFEDYDDKKSINFKVEFE